MKKVSVKFNCSGKWAVSLTKQIEFVKDQIIDDLPLPFAYRVQECGKGKIVDEVKVEEYIEPIKLYLPKELSVFGMKKLREIGEVYSVTDNKKDELLGKILSCQEYTKELLDSLDDEELCEICKAMSFDIVSSEDLSSEQTDKIVSDILDFKTDK